jgi:hypothetical protein
MNVSGLKSLELVSGAEPIFLITESIPPPQPGTTNFLNIREFAPAGQQLSQKSLYLFKRITKQV